MELSRWSSLLIVKRVRCALRGHGDALKMWFLREFHHMVLVTRCRHATYSFSVIWKLLVECV